MERGKTIKVLNTLITINNDRIKRYETVVKETEEQYLKTLCAKFSDTSKKCKQELTNEVTKLGGTPAEGTKTSGKFLRILMDAKAILSSWQYGEAILNSCDYGENMAKYTYKKALKNDAEILCAEQQTRIKAQHILLVAEHNKVKSMRDTLVRA